MRSPVPSLRRSFHFVPGPNERMLEKAVSSEADCLILDLEDSVPPDKKDESRKVYCDWLREVDFGGKETAIRINSLNSPWGMQDLIETMESPPDLYVVPKPERLTEVQLVESVIDKYETRFGHEFGTTRLILIAGETPSGVINVNEVSSTARIDGVTWGAEDLAAALGVSRNRSANGDYLRVFEYSREQTLLASVANKVQPIDTVYVEFRDHKGLERDCEHAKAIGFTGKLTIHPDQITVVNQVFTPSLDEVREAEHLVEAFDEARTAGKLAFEFKGKMVDAPHLAHAQATLERAKQVGLI